MIFADPVKNLWKEAREGDKHSMEFVFAEERKRANDRIIQATKTHENTIKMAVLNMMNLGGGVK